MKYMQVQIDDNYTLAVWNLHALISFHLNLVIGFCEEMVLMVDSRMCSSVSLCALRYGCSFAKMCLNTTRNSTVYVHERACSTFTLIEKFLILEVEERFKQLSITKDS